jgi:hypothetical protein
MNSDITCTSRSFGRRSLNCVHTVPLFAGVVPPIMSFSPSLCWPFDRGLFRKCLYLIRIWTKEVPSYERDYYFWLCYHLWCSCTRSCFTCFSKDSQYDLDSPFPRRASLQDIPIHSFLIQPSIMTCNPPLTKLRGGHFFIQRMRLAVVDTDFSADKR